MTGQTWHTCEQTAELLGVTEKTVRNWIRCGRVETNDPDDNRGVYLVRVTPEMAEHARKKRKREGDKAQRAQAAAAAIGAGGHEQIDPQQLAALASTEATGIVFVLPSGAEVTLTTKLLRELTSERRRNSRMKDMRAWLDERGLHLRWGKHGGMCLHRSFDRCATTIVVAFAHHNTEAA